MKASDKSNILRQLPQVEEVLQSPQVSGIGALLPHSVLSDCARAAVDAARKTILDGSTQEVDTTAIADDTCVRALATLRPSLRRVINATGVVVHTNLGRSPLAEEAIAAVTEAARSYSTLEYNTGKMARGSRHEHIEHLICALTGAEAAIAVNNNAAAVMMVLTEFAAGHEAVVSRGELVEIGGSFRIPDIMAQSNARMVEVGTTNKTHAADYERAVTPETAMFLKVHTSNYRVVGFTESVSAADMRKIADAENARRKDAGDTGRILVFEDLGSGALVHLGGSGVFSEPTVGESLRAGCDLVSFSGDKLLGGPQAGIVIGSAELISRLKKNPLARALRLDKMTLAALEATLRLYLDPETVCEKVPTLHMLTESADKVQARAEALAKQLHRYIKAREAHIDVIDEVARAGGGSLPMTDIPTSCVRLQFVKGAAQDCEEYLVQQSKVPIIARIKNECVMFDARTLSDENLPEICTAVRAYFDTLA